MANLLLQYPCPVFGQTAYIENNRTSGQGLEVIAVDLNQQFSVHKSENSASQNPLERTVEWVLEYLQTPPPDVTITIRSDIPIASGLGSGAAVSTALARAISLTLNQPLDRARLNDIIYEIEKLQSTHASGIDNTVVVYECPTLTYIRNHPIEMISITGAFHFLIADTGQGALTRIAVGDVRELYNSDPSGIQLILDKIEEVVLECPSSYQVWRGCRVRHSHDS